MFTNSIGVLHTGNGTTQINSLLTALNIPAVSHAMMDRRIKGHILISLYLLFYYKFHVAYT